MMRAKGFVLLTGVALMSCVAEGGPPASGPVDTQETAIRPQANSAPSARATGTTATTEPASSEPKRVDFWFEGVPVQGALLTGRVPSDTVSLQFEGEDIDLGDDGFFIVGLDRDSPAEVTLAAKLKDGGAIERHLSVAPGDWKLEHINAPYRAGVSSAAFQERRGAELAQIVASRSKNVQSDGWRQDFIWPVTGRQSGFFGSQRVYQGKPGSYHGGADIAVPTGTVFVAPADGVVTLAARDEFTLEGKLIIIDHGHGLNSAFLHASAILVNEGDRVRQGQPIGQVGQSGRATGPHLHWGLKWNDARIDPLLVAGPVPR
jgi:murein DD-endopeptidase MepM/ murein hydrolase activator NlpD